MDVLGALHKYFGFDRFLEAQEEIVQTILDGKDTLVIKPTGGGKSLCYQLPALLREGITVVVSPLIALMKDQVDALEARQIPATFINSTLSAEEYRNRLDGMEKGAYKMVYVAPERFRAEGFVRRLQGLTIAFFAIDEAHCLSQWGHDFRPDYLRLGQAVARLGHPQVAAFTATATPEVRADILTHLKLREPKTFIAGFSRPNLRLTVRQVQGEAEKLERIKELIFEHRVGIIYCSTRKKVDSVTASLEEQGVSVIAYHGGMSDEARSEAQSRFMSGAVEVAVATNAFGMGIDRADIRFVAHYQTPGSVEAYYQEAGRAGRDGEPAVCELLFNFADTQVQEFFVEGSNPPLRLIQEVYRELQAGRDQANEVFRSHQEITERLGKGTNPMAVSTSISILSRHGIIERFDVPGQRIRGTRLSQPDLTPTQLPLDEKALAEKEARDRGKLKAMVEFAYARDCRQAWIRRYFGEDDPEDCGNCDVCRRYQSQELRPGTAREKEILLKALSGVARMCRRNGADEWEACYGRGRIVQMLVGSKSREIITSSLDQLSTYGLLKAEGVKYINELFREMEDAGLVAVTSGQYPMLHLTAKGHRVMTGGEEVQLCWPTSRGSTRLPSDTFALNADEQRGPRNEKEADLLARLKELRRAEAQRQGVPPYVIFTNRTLEAMARDRPRDEEEALLLPGIGTYRARRYLKAFLAEIHN